MPKLFSKIEYNKICRVMTSLNESLRISNTPIPYPCKLNQNLNTYTDSVTMESTSSIPFSCNTYRIGNGQEWNWRSPFQSVIVKKESDQSTFGSAQMRTTIHHIQKPPIPQANQSLLLQFHISIKKNNQSINQAIN